MLADLSRDVRYDSRALAHAPGVTVVAVAVLALEPGSVDLTGDGGEPERLAVMRTTGNLFETIGLQPLLGRTFAPDDAANRAVLVSEGFWLRRLGGDPAAVGRTTMLDGSPHLVVGVVPRDFRFPNA